MRSIYWFRNDLRIADNQSLLNCIRQSAEVLPLYVIDETFFEKSTIAHTRAGAWRLKFLSEALCDLQAQLQAIGSHLHISFGNPIAVLAELANAHQVARVYAQSEAAHDERMQEQNLLAKLTNTELHLYEQSTLYAMSDLPFDLNQLPKVFTQYRNLLEKSWIIKPLSPTITSMVTPAFWKTLDGHQALTEIQFPKPSKRAVFGFTGGSLAAHERLKYYFWDSQLLSSYKETRNGMLGGDYSSKFSPWLALGCISARQIYWEIKNYETHFGANESTYWLVFELMWRDYFRLVAYNAGACLFFKSGLNGKQLQLSKDKLRFEQWCNGKTGNSFIDANMRELQLSGFMSNRGRQNVASYLVNDLKVDWRWGAWWFEHQLIDYDACSNWGNWAYIAGVGNDPRPNRYFNISRQAEMYDPQGEYQQHWLKD